MAKKKPKKCKTIFLPKPKREKFVPDDEDYARLRDISMWSGYKLKFA